jgi:pimeloyl-ACP methyl ester carboxylesterase
MGVPRPHIPFGAVPSVPPLWRESRFGLEAAQLLRSPVWRGAGVAPGEGRPVLLVPGFMAGDSSLATMTKWLRVHGYRTRRAGIRANVGCSEEACLRLEERLEALAERTSQRVAIIGQSRGGVLARAVAARRPDLVSGIVTLGAPSVSMLRVHPLVLLQVGVLGALGSTGRVPGLFSMNCLRGPCCEAFRADLAGGFPADVGYLAVYSRSDGIVDWRACLDPGAHELVEIRASHCGMAVNQGAYEQVARALAAFAGRETSLPRAA